MYANFTAKQYLKSQIEKADALPQEIQQAFWNEGCKLIDLGTTAQQA